MTFLEKRPGAEKIVNLLRQAAHGSLELSISVVNWGEVYYSIWRTAGRQTAEEKMGQIAQLPIEIVPADRDLTKLAAEFRARHRLPYADCFAAALAHQRKATLATADADFLQVKHLLKILWTTEA